MALLVTTDFTILARFTDSRKRSGGSGFGNVTSTEYHPDFMGPFLVPLIS